MFDISTVRISEGPVGEHRLLEVPFCECAMRGSDRPHPALLVFHARSGCMRSRWIYLRCESRRPRGVNIAYWRSLFANAQFEAVWRCITLGPCRHAPKSITLDGDCVKTGSLRRVVVASRFRGPIWRNLQCEAVRRRTIFSSLRHAQNAQHPPC